MSIHDTTKLCCGPFCAECATVFMEADRTIERLTRERDEARKEIEKWSVAAKLWEFNSNVMFDKHEKLKAEAEGFRKAKPVVFRIEPFEDGEFIVTADGEMVGNTVSKHNGNAILSWIGSAWAELIKANQAISRPSGAEGGDA